MSFELIKVHPATMIGGESVPAVNLRDLHAFLGTETQYKDWSQRRINDSMAVEGRDFLTLKFERQVPSGRKRQIDHLVTLDTAKHIGMLERNEKGRQVREYFIRVEKEFRAGRRNDHVLHWMMERALEIAPAEKIMRLLQTRHEYGTIAQNGKARTGWRAPAFVASPHRTEDARIFNKGMAQLELTVQLDLPKLVELLEGGKLS